MRVVGFCTLPLRIVVVVFSDLTLRFWSYLSCFVVVVVLLLGFALQGHRAIRL